MIEFTVFGIAAPQGSLRGYNRGGRVVLVSDNPKTRPWREMVAWEAGEALRASGAFEGPVWLRLAFHLPRPKSCPKSRIRPSVKPDVDKLSRAVMDAITIAGLWRDDAQVVSLSAMKLYTEGEPRLVVQIRGDVPAEEGPGT